MRLSWYHLQSTPRYICFYRQTLKLFWWKFLVHDIEMISFISVRDNPKNYTLKLRGLQANHFFILRPTTVKIRLFYMSDSHVPQPRGLVGQILTFIYFNDDINYKGTRPSSPSKLIVISSYSSNIHYIVTTRFITIKR